MPAGYLYYQGKQVQADAWSALADEPVMSMVATMPFQILPIFIQIKVEDPDICCSMFINAELYADTFDKCFMMAEVVNSDRICVPLHGFRLFSINKETGRGDETGIIVECVKSSYTGMHGGIIYGTALDRIRRKLWRDGHTDDFANKRIKK